MTGAAQPARGSRPDNDEPGAGPGPRPVSRIR
jgi:hypothetical protein